MHAVLHEKHALKSRSSTMFRAFCFTLLLVLAAAPSRAADREAQAGAIVESAETATLPH